MKKYVVKFKSIQGSKIIGDFYDISDAYDYMNHRFKMLMELVSREEDGLEEISVTKESSEYRNSNTYFKLWVSEEE